MIASAPASADVEVFAGRVVAHSPVGCPDINTPDELLGAPDGEATHFEEVNANSPGFVTVEFPGAFLVDGPGPDVIIYLTD